jgi:hypothetical protein
VAHQLETPSAFSLGVQLRLDSRSRHGGWLETGTMVDYDHLELWPMTWEPRKLHLNPPGAVLESVETRFDHGQLHFCQGITGETDAAAKSLDGRACNKLGVRLGRQDETDALRLSHGRQLDDDGLQGEKEAEQPPRRLDDHFQCPAFEE